MRTGNYLELLLYKLQVNSKHSRTNMVFVELKSRTYFRLGMVGTHLENSEG